MIVAIHHAQITIPTGAEALAREFYCGVLRLVEIAKPGELAGRGGFWLAIGDLQLHIGTEDNIERSNTKAHVAFTVEKLDHWREVLNTIDVAITDGIQIPGVRRFEFRDPFGNRIEFMESLDQKLF